MKTVYFSSFIHQYHLSFETVIVVIYIASINMKPKVPVLFIIEKWTKIK